MVGPEKPLVKTHISPLNVTHQQHTNQIGMFGPGQIFLGHSDPIFMFPWSI